MSIKCRVSYAVGSESDPHFRSCGAPAIAINEISVAVDSNDATEVIDRIPVCDRHRGWVVNVLRRDITLAVVPDTRSGFAWQVVPE